MQRGFSLVELSIVLVILGLLTGGILAGQSLIRGAELRTITTQYNSYIAAVQTFRDKYFALPGDMTNATSFWKAADADPATCRTTQGAGAATCNGNGDGRIQWDGAAWSTSNESFRFWQHLANAGLIEGSYTGINAGAGNGYVSNEGNVPRGRIGSSLWFTEYWTVTAGDTYRFAGNYGNYLMTGTRIATSSPDNPLLKPEELWNIDVKMDDGKPGVGKVVVFAYPSGLSSCTTSVSNNPATLSADYLLNSSTVACAPYFRQAF